MKNILVVVINLDGDKKRLTNSKKQLEDIGIAFIRVKAVNGSSVDPKKMRVSNVNAAACWFSHVKCYEMLLDSRAERMLILEDDFIIKNKIKFLKEIESSSSSEENITQLGFLSFGVLPKFEQIILLANKIILRLPIYLPLKIFRTTLYVKIMNRRARYDRAGRKYVPSDYLAGSHGYIIDRKAAEILIAANNPVLLPVDGFLQAICRSGTLSSKRITRSLIGQVSGISSIELTFTKRR